jgi:hypothetical protein
MPSAYTAGSGSDLIADINAANQAGGSNTILLTANTTFDLSAVNNTTNGANGLPVIAAKESLAITGQGGDVIQRDPAAPAFRLFDVAGQGALTLANLTLQNGLAFGSGSSADGGAVYSQGSLVLNHVTVRDNRAEGSKGIYGSKKVSGQDAAGGGIWSSGSLVLENGTLVQGNQAVGGFGMINTSGAGGNAFGGGLYVAGGTASLTGATVSGNSAQGGSGGLPFCGYDQCLNDPPSGPGGSAFGGGLYVGGGAVVTLCDCMVESNAAGGGSGNPSGQGDSGGLYIAKAKLSLDAFTLANTLNNTADIDPNIHGSYVLQPC